LVTLLTLELLHRLVRREEHLAADGEAAGSAEYEPRFAADVGQADFRAEADRQGSRTEFMPPHVDVDAPAEGDLRVCHHREGRVRGRVDLLEKGVTVCRVASRHGPTLRVLRPRGGNGAGDRLLPSLSCLDDVEPAVVLRAQPGLVREIELEPVLGGGRTALE